MDALGRPRLTTTYLLFGMGARDKGLMSAAEQWFLDSLAVSEQLGDTPMKALACFYLAGLHALQGSSGETSRWWSQWITLSEGLGSLDEVPIPKELEWPGKPHQGLAWSVGAA